MLIFRSLVWECEHERFGEEEFQILLRNRQHHLNYLEHFLLFKEPNTMQHLANNPFHSLDPKSFLYIS